MFGLIRALGAETAGALRFTTDAVDSASDDDPAPREITLQELDDRIARHEQLPLTVWDGKVRMSVAGLQDKLLVYLDRPVEEGGRLFLVEGRRLASTHLLKPDTAQSRTPHLAINEHFACRWPAAWPAGSRGPPAANTSSSARGAPLRPRGRGFTPTRSGYGGGNIIDTCQACDPPVSYKYERNLGSAPAVRHIRDGVSFERLFHCAELTSNKKAARFTLLRWALFQFLVGNSDAHGKNFSFSCDQAACSNPPSGTT